MKDRINEILIKHFGDDPQEAHAQIEQLLVEARIETLRTMKRPRKQHKYKTPNKGEAGYNAAVGNLEHLIERQIAELEQQLRKNT